MSANNYTPRKWIEGHDNYFSALRHFSPEVLRQLVEGGYSFGVNRGTGNIGPTGPYTNTEGFCFVGKLLQLQLGQTAYRTPHYTYAAERVLQDIQEHPRQPLGWDGVADEIVLANSFNHIIRLNDQGGLRRPEDVRRLLSPYIGS